MYITEVSLKNIRCFDELTIDFAKLGSSILIAGDNGDGKSTILRSIAMGLCDESSAAALLRELPGDFVRKNTTRGVISVSLQMKNRRRYKIETSIAYSEAFERVQQRLFNYVNGKWGRIKEPEDFPWDAIFVTAYGAGVRTLGTADYQHYFAVDAVYQLFKYDAPLQNPELAIRRLIEKARKNEAVKIHLKERNVLRICGVPYVTY